MRCTYANTTSAIRLLVAALLLSTAPAAGSLTFQSPELTLLADADGGTVGGRIHDYSVGLDAGPNLPGRRGETCVTAPMAHSPVDIVSTR